MSETAVKGEHFYGVICSRCWMWIDNPHSNEVKCICQPDRIQPLRVTTAPAGPS